MRDFLDKVKEVFDREWSGEEKVLIMLCCVLLGVIYGFLQLKKEFPLAITMEIIITNMQMTTG
mgnify:CR=1 FL=1